MANEENIKPYRWPKGVSGNPAGKPKGAISPKQKIQQMFASNPEYFHEWLEEYIENPKNRQHIVEMIDGKPKQGVNLDLTIPQSLIELIKYGNSDKGTDTEVSEENPS